MVVITNKNGEEWRDLTGWEDFYYKKSGKHLNINTLKKRRQASGLGQVVPPRTILLTYEEFEAVLATPLPGCTSIPTQVTRPTPSGRKE